ncbi:C2H2 type zinc finger domain-containing protein [Phyllosticta citricarpa]
MPLRMSHYYYNEADLAMMDIFPASSSSSTPSSTIYAPPCHMPPHQRSGYDPRTTSVSMTAGYLPQPSAMPHQSYSHQNYWTGHQHSVPQQHPLPQATMGLPSMAPYPSSTIAYAHPQQFAPETTLPSSYSLHHRTESVVGVEYSRSISPSSNSPDLRAYGYLNKNGTWTCAYPGCTSKAVFTRGCDLRKHHKRHTKSFFCRQEGCPQATGGGFSSKKDLARHEAKHNPGVICEWEGCERIFSRVDNMRDHVKRIHLKGARPQPAKRGSTS